MRLRTHAAAERLHAVIAEESSLPVHNAMSSGEIRAKMCWSSVLAFGAV